MPEGVRTITAGPTVFTSSADFIIWVKKIIDLKNIGHALAVVDPAAAQSEGGLSLLNSLKKIMTMQCIGPATNETELLAIADSTESAGLTFGIGGGATMDTAKLISAMRDPAHRQILMSRSRVGHLLLNDSPPSDHVLALVPTTLGTGSEAGPSACLSDGSRKRLISGTQLKADVVLLDAMLTQSLPDRVAFAGIFEIIFRLSTPLILTPKPRSTSDALALASMKQLVAAGEDLLESETIRESRETLQTIAELSAFSQTGWTSLGRDPYSTLPWIIASELSMVAGISKMDAVAAILPTYWRQIEAGNTRFGAIARLNEVTEAMGLNPASNSASTALTQFLQRWGLSMSLALSSTIVHETSRKISRAWGGGLPMLQGLTSANITDFLTEAVGTERGQDGGRASGAA